MSSRPVRALALALTGGVLVSADAPAFPEKAVGLPASRNVYLHSVFDPRDHYNDCWGYTAPDGREYALLGTRDGVSVIDISRYEGPVERRFFVQASSPWRDIKTYQHYAYAVNETGNGLLIIDLEDPDDPQYVKNYGGFQTAHNLFIDESSGIAYIAGANQSDGVLMFSLADPENPTPMFSWFGEYSHDVMVQNGRMYVSAIFGGPARLIIVDVTQPGYPTLGEIVYFGAFTHNAWVTPDDQYVMTTDEVIGGACNLWDIRDLSNPGLSSYYFPDRDTIPHNAHIDGNLAYISHYTLGVRIVDITDRENIREIGWLDTNPDWLEGYQGDGPFNGCWGTFPFYPQSPDLFIASDRSRGLFVMEFNSTAAGFEAPEAPVEPARSVSVAPVPEGLRLGDVYPQPVRPGRRALLSLELPFPSRVHAEVFDAAGRRIRVIEDGRRAPGVHYLGWDGRDASGGPAAAGVYFAVVDVGGHRFSRRITLIH